ncbi:MAG: transposase [Methylobacter sp.]|nr:transposase [Methylobacter sp.]
MSTIINDPVLVSAIQDLARGIKSEADLSSLTRELLKITVEASLNAEMEAHLGYPKHSPTGHNSGNGRNGYGSKSLKGDHGVLDIEQVLGFRQFSLRGLDAVAGEWKLVTMAFNLKRMHVLAVR